MSKIDWDLCNYMGIKVNDIQNKPDLLKMFLMSKKTLKVR